MPGSQSIGKLIKERIYSQKWRLMGTRGDVGVVELEWEEDVSDVRQSLCLIGVYKYP